MCSPPLPARPRVCASVRPPPPASRTTPARAVREAWRLVDAVRRRAPAESLCPPLRDPAQPLAPSDAPRPNCQSTARCSNPVPRGRPLHKYVPISASTPWGAGELSRTCPQLPLGEGDSSRSHGCGHVQDGSPQDVDHQAAANRAAPLSTARPQENGPCPQLLHSAVHCSATQRARSLVRVKGVTVEPGLGCGKGWVILWATLWGSRGRLCIGCAELFRVHSTPRSVHRSTHRGGGQNFRADLVRCGYPRFPQALLLRPPV